MKPVARAWILALGCLIALAPQRARAGCETPAPVRFAHGTHATHLQGGVPRGDRDCFTLTARARQHLSVSQDGDATTSNIVFQLYQPGWKLQTAGPGLRVTARPLPGAGEGDDASQWSGALPLSGTYLLVIGTTRGGGTYHLDIDIQ